MTTQNFLPYVRQSIDQSDIEAVTTALKSEIITRGEIVQNFEKAIAEYCGATYAVAFNSGSSALYACYQAADLGSHDRMITTPNTFVSTVSTAMHHRVTPVFVDINRRSGNLNLEQVKLNLEIPSLRGRTAVVPVHFSGIPVDMEKLDKSISDPDVIVIEDAAHALGSTYRDGQKVGSCAWSHMTAFSFHPAKNITTGEGGIVTTNHESYYRRLQRIRNNGIENQGVQEPWLYDVKEISGNFNLTDFQAALGLSQLKRLDAFVTKRRELVKVYREKLAGLEFVRCFDSIYDSQSAYHLFVLQIDFEELDLERGEAMTELKERGIGTQVHYIPVYRHRIIEGNLSEYFPETEAYYSQALSLPLFYEMSVEDVERVVKELKDVLGF